MTAFIPVNEHGPGRIKKEFLGWKTLLDPGCQHRAEE
jgi:hypothetical protein